MSEINVQTVKLDKIIPYWRNPRKNDVAVEKVTESIRQYGYQSPIVVDKKMVIIAGHTRYAALRALGWDEVDVVVADMPEKKAKEFRIIDNRTSEYATWTPELNLELKEFTDPLILETFFPNINLDTNFGTIAPAVTQDKVDAIADKLQTQFTDDSAAKVNAPKITLLCPHCLESITLSKAELEGKL